MARSYRVKLADAVISLNVGLGLDVAALNHIAGTGSLGVVAGLSGQATDISVGASALFAPSITLVASGDVFVLPWVPESNEPQVVDAATPEQRFSVLTGHREEAWEFQLLTHQDGPVGMLETVTEASFDASVGNTVRTGGSLTCREDIDWMKYRVQPWYSAVVNGVRVRFPIGVFIPTTPGVQFSDDGRTWNVELMDKLVLLDQEFVTNTYYVDVGDNLADAVAQCIAETGETRYLVEPSDKTASAVMVWEPGTSRLRIINDILDSMNYFSLWADAFGVFRAESYTEPLSRDVAWSFADDQYSIYAPDFALDEDLYKVPNRVTCVSRTDGEEPALVATAANENPDSPYSFQSRGRWIDHVETDVEAADETTLGQIAARRLLELSQVTANYDLDVAPLPLNLNDLIRFTYSPTGINNEPAVIQSWSLSAQTGALMKLRFRRVVE